MGEGSDFRTRMECTRYEVVVMGFRSEIQCRKFTPGNSSQEMKARKFVYHQLLPKEQTKGSPLQDLDRDEVHIRVWVEFLGSNVSLS